MTTTAMMILVDFASPPPEPESSELPSPREPEEAPELDELADFSEANDLTEKLGTKVCASWPGKPGWS